MTQDPAPLGVYVHWPYCARICPYCDFNVYRARGGAEADAALVEAICQDLRGQAAWIGPRQLASIFFGGGTPSLMDPAAVARIIDEAKRLWGRAEQLEVTLEANPTDAEAGRFEGFAAAGVNRLSLGLQALNDADLRFLGRNHDAAEALRAAQVAGLCFPRLSVDLIYARPGQTPTGWAAELSRALDLGAEHVSPYQLTIEPGTAFERARARGRFVSPDEAVAAELYETTQAVLEAAGFDAYEVSNHARGPGARSRHNLVYWRGEDYVGVGPGAHGRLTREGERHATTAQARPADYVSTVSRQGVGWAEAEPLHPQSAAEERLLMGLRIDEGVAFEEVAALGLSPELPSLADLVDLGLLVPDRQRLRATRKGRLVLDNLTRLLITG